MFVSAVMFALMGIATKYLGSPGAGAPVPPAEITLFRFLFGAIAMLPLLAAPGARLLGHDKLGLIWRGLSGGLAVYTYFLAIRHTTLTNAVILNFTSIIFAPLISAIVLRERVVRAAWVGIPVAFVGIALVTRPEVGTIRVGDLYGLTSGFMAGWAITAVRRLRRQETAASVFFYFSLIGMPVAAIGCVGHGWVWPTATGWWLLVAMAASSVVAQMLMTYGYKYVKTSEGGLMTLSQIVYSAVAGALLFDEPIGLATVVGGILILGAGLGASLSSSAAAAREATKTT